MTIAHINATSKNAADEKLKQHMRRFATVHSHPASILLISGNFYNINPNFVLWMSPNQIVNDTDCMIQFGKNKNFLNDLKCVAC